MPAHLCGGNDARSPPAMHGAPSRCGTSSGISEMSRLEKGAGIGGP